MTKRRRAVTRGTQAPATRKRPWLLILLLLVLPAALLWKEYPAIVRYLKMTRM